MLGLTSTGIDAVSISVYSRDSDGPITMSSGIGAASLSNSRIGSKSLELLPSSPDGLGHNLLQTGGGMPLPRAIMEKAVASLSTTGFERSKSTRSTERLGLEEHPLNYQLEGMVRD